MSDDLKKRLIDWEMWDEGDINDTREEAHAYIEELEAKLASVIAAYRIEAMRREDYSHEAFDQHIAELKGEDRG